MEKKKTAKKYITAGYIAKNQKNGNVNMKLAKNLQLVVDGTAIDTEYVNIIKTFSVKHNGKDLDIGKLVEPLEKDGTPKLNNDGSRNRFVALNEGVGFRTQDGDVVSVKNLSLSSRDQEIKALEERVADGKLTEGKAEEIKQGMFFLDKLTLSVPVE